MKPKANKIAKNSPSNKDTQDFNEKLRLVKNSLELWCRTTDATTLKNHIEIKESYEKLASINKQHAKQVEGYLENFNKLVTYLIERGAK